jgi:D-serine ammonia-lyase
MEGTKLQLASTFATTHAVVVSTLMEAWEVVNSELVTDGTVKDVREDR